MQIFLYVELITYIELIFTFFLYGFTHKPNPFYLMSVFYEGTKLGKQFYMIKL